MKKLLFILVLMLVMVTGCGESDGLSSIPSNYQGTYSSRSRISSLYYVDAIRINYTTAQIVSSTSASGYKDVDFSKAKTYDIKDIVENGSGKGIYYNLYEGDTKKYQCFVTFGRTSCDSSNGISKGYTKD